MKPRLTLFVLLATLAGGRSDTLTDRLSVAGTVRTSARANSKEANSPVAPHTPASPSTTQTTAHDTKMIPAATPSAAGRIAEPNREAGQKTTLPNAAYAPELVPRRTVSSVSVPARAPANPVNPVLKSGWLASPKTPALKPAIPVAGRASRSKPAAVGGSTLPWKAGGVVSGNQFGSKHGRLQP